MKHLLLSSFLLLTLVSRAQADWPQFRGPNGQGHATAKGLVHQWSENSNIYWKAAVPGEGWSSPVIVGNHIWMTTATDKGKSLRALCYANDSGKLLHNVELFTLKKTDRRHAKNSFATPTPIIHQGRVYVHFGYRGTACLTMDGKVVWKHAKLKFHQAYSGASSPIIFGNMLILTCDGGDNQFVATLNLKNGDVIWKTKRQHLERAYERNRTARQGWQGYFTMGYTTPLVVASDGRFQIVSPAADHIAAYDSETGKELWWYPYNGFSLVARPVYGHGLVYTIGVVQQGKHLLHAFRPSARGKVGKEDIAWVMTKGIPHVPSPLLIGDRLYLLHDKGIAMSVNAKTGKLIWQKRIGGNYSASPMYADGKIILVSEEGKTTVIKPAEAFTPLATNQLKGRFLASPAASGKAIYLRSDKFLYRIERK